ncbi:MAG TPA: hypothetical protein PL182_09470 [Pseudobdellovibrionaceae bacterium]|nr:hypothetical protein [Pseudobdellovibrionaceae bacterium]
MAGQRKKFKTRLIMGLCLASSVSLLSCKRDSFFDEKFDPRLFKESIASWLFSDPNDYAYDPDFIEVGDGRASLKRVDTEHSGNDFARGLHSGTLRSEGNWDPPPGTGPSWIPRGRPIGPLFSATGS